jgi:hypothetical protein
LLQHGDDRDESAEDRGYDDIVARELAEKRMQEEATR